MSDYAQKLLAKFSWPSVPMISYQDMAKMDDLEQLTVDGGQGIKIPLYTSSIILFRWYMEDDSEWSLHRHDCKESLKIISGVFEYNGVLYGDGQTSRIIHISPEVPHTLKTIKAGVFYVEFANPYK